MRTTTTLILTAILAAGQQAPPPPPPPPPPQRIGGEIPQTGDASIEGLVRRLDTGEPLAAAQVQLTGLPDRTGALSLRVIPTDAAGRFVFERLPAATYTLRISAANFFAPPVGGTSAAAVTATVTVAGGQRVSNVTFSLVPGGVIHGLIRDDAGRPAANLPVWALRVAYRDGRKTTENARTVQSDDRGAFRLFYMPPGEYFVFASGTVSGNPVAGYYPGVPVVESATLVRVRGGDEIAADMRILPARLFRISGTVVNAIPELAADPQGFILMPRDRKFDDGSAASILPNLVSGRTDGYFEIRALPGLYDLMPAAAVRPGAPIAAGNPHYYTGRVPVEVRDRDVEGIRVTINRGADLTVQVNARGAPSSSLANVRLALRPVDALPSVLTNNNLVAPSADGKMGFRALPEGRYALVMPATSPGLHISDIRQGARNIYDQGVITVGKDIAEPVEVVLSADGGRIEGTIEGADKSSTTVRVSLIPEGPRRDNFLFYKRTSPVEGRFVLSDIPAGSYKLYAWDDLPAGADQNAEFLATYESRGRAVTVRAGVPIPDIALPLIRR